MFYVHGLCSPLWALWTMAESVVLLSAFGVHNYKVISLVGPRGSIVVRGFLCEPTLSMCQCARAHHMCIYYAYPARALCIYCARKLRITYVCACVPACVHAGGCAGWRARTTTYARLPFGLMISTHDV